MAPKSNFRIARFKLRSMKQDNGESVDVYMKTVIILALDLLDLKLLLVIQRRGRTTKNSKKRECKMQIPMNTC